MNWILTVTLFTPLAGALLILVLPAEDKKTIHRVGIGCALVTLVLSIVFPA